MRAPTSTGTPKSLGGDLQHGLAKEARMQHASEQARVPLPSDGTAPDAHDRSLALAEARHSDGRAQSAAFHAQR